MSTKTIRSDADLLAEIEADQDEPIGAAIDGAPLRDIAAAVARRNAAESDIAAAVARARAAGMSWAVIGAGLGVSRQAALKRFS